MNHKIYLERILEDLRYPENWFPDGHYVAMTFKKGDRSYKLRVDLGRITINDFELTGALTEEYFDLNEVFINMYYNKYREINNPEIKSVIDEAGAEMFRKTFL